MTLHVAMERSVVDSAGLFANETWLTAEMEDTQAAWVATYVAGTLSVSILVCVMRSRLASESASVGKTGCPSSVTLSSSQNEWCWIFSMSFQFLTIQCPTMVPSICIPPWAGLARGTLEVNRLGSLRGRYTTQGATHILSINTLSQNGYGSDIPSCSCNSATPTFKSSPSSGYASVLSAVSSKAIRRLRLSSAETH